MKYEHRFTKREATPADSGSGDLGIASSSPGVNEGHEVQARAPITVRLHRSLMVTAIGFFSAPVPYLLFFVLLFSLPSDALTEHETALEALRLIGFVYGFAALFYFWRKFTRARRRLIIVVRKRRIEFFWKDRGAEQSVNGWVPWSRVQAIVTVAPSDGYIHHQTHIYLSTDPNSWDSVRDSIPVSSEVIEEPPSPALGELTSFPAVRLALRYSPGAEKRSSHRSKAVLSAPHKSHTLPEHQIRYALWAFRPDLCHGFEDLAEAHPEESR